jgi:glycosyltransferase involved in cell wall biosynthesis
MFWALFSRRLDFIVIMCASSVYRTPVYYALVRAIASLRGAQMIFLFVNCGYNIANLAELVSGSPAGKRRVRQARRLVARSDILPVAISPEACRDVEDHFGLHGVRNIGFAPGIAKADFTDELPQDPPMFINIGNYSHRKGQDLFLDIAFRCLEKNPSLRFCWVGKHVPRPEDVPEIVARDVVANFHFTKTKAPPFDLIRQSSGLIFTSRSEAFGLVVSEAMAMRRSVFCFEGTGGSYQAGDVGHVFARFDVPAMAGTVLAHAAKPVQERVDHAAFERYRREFSPGTFARRFAALLDDLPV